MLVEIVIPLIVFVSIVILVALSLGYQLKIKQIKANNIHKALEAMDTIDSEVIKALQDDRTSQQKDYRKGFFLLAIALAIAVFSQFLSIFKSSQIPDAILGLAAFPAFLGITFICLALFSKR